MSDRPFHPAMRLMNEADRKLRIQNFWIAGANVPGMTACHVMTCREFSQRGGASSFRGVCAIAGNVVGRRYSHDEQRYCKKTGEPRRTDGNKHCAKSKAVAGDPRGWLRLLSCRRPWPPRVEPSFSLGLDEILNMEITSVSKKPQTVFPSSSTAVFVITADDIRRSGQPPSRMPCGWRPA
ncbi:MAG: hypothetical protein IPP88_18450 [Betaproteobacteria bacterium]|nr:hypothetical protein [Betaproteobacteria bacterium]